MDAGTMLKRAENVTFETVADEAILIRLDTGTYFSLNKVGTHFWQMLDGQETIGQQAATIANQYEVDVDMVLDDLLELAHELREEELVTEL